MFKLHIYALRSDVAFGCNAQCPLNCHDIVYCGYNEVGFGDKSLLNDIVMDQWTARRFYKSITFTITWREANMSIPSVKGLARISNAFSKA